MRNGKWAIFHIAEHIDRVHTESLLRAQRAARVEARDDSLAFPLVHPLGFPTFDEDLWSGFQVQRPGPALADVTRNTAQNVASRPDLRFHKHANTGDGVSADSFVVGHGGVILSFLLAQILLSRELQN